MGAKDDKGGLIPAVSVIIPTYNRASFLKEAIASVRSQTFRDYELLVIDDGSTDRTSALLEEYGDSIIVIKQDNRGVSAARNTGLAHSRANLIALLDSDDLWLSDKLEYQVSFMKNHPELMICQTNETWFRNGQHLKQLSKHLKRSGDLFAQSLELCAISPSAVMMRRALFEQVGIFDERMPACEDYDLWLRVTAHYQVGLVEAPLVIKRGGHEDQLSHTVWGLDRFRIKAIAKLLEQVPLTPEKRRQALANLEERCRIFAIGCIKRGRIEDGKRYRELPEQYG